MNLTKFSWVNGIAISLLLVGAGCSDGSIRLQNETVRTPSGAGQLQIPPKQVPNSSEVHETPTYSYFDAPEHIGEYANVRGIVRNVRKTGTAVFLNFCLDYRTCPFSAVVLASSFHNFGDLENYSYLGVTITGQINEYNGRAEIVLDSPNQISIIDFAKHKDNNGEVNVREPETFDFLKFKYDALQYTQDIQEGGDMQAFMISSYPRWDVSQEDCKIIFSGGGLPPVEATVEFAGSYFDSGPKSSWMWDWYNTSVSPDCLPNMHKIRDFGTLHDKEIMTIPEYEVRGFNPLTTGSWGLASEIDADTNVALAAYILRAKGIYHAKIGEQLTQYWVITDLKIKQ